MADLEVARKAKEAKKQMSELVAFAPDNVPDKEKYVQLINQQILGRSKDGQPRPMSDLIYFLQVCKGTGLNPFIKQVYAIYRWDKNAGKEVLSIQTGIDGLRSVADRSGLYAGSDDAIVMYGEGGNSKIPVSATVTVYKLNSVTGERMPTSATARWDEYYPSQVTQRSFWDSMPANQLSKCAEALALRKAFPQTGQLYVPEEMHQAEPMFVGETLPSIESEIANAKSFKELQLIVQKLPAADRKAVIAQVNNRAKELK